jgi:hypothetical protein
MMAERIAIYPDTAAATEAAKMAGPASADWSRQPQFGMTFEEQQEVLYQTLVAFQEPEHP